MIVFLSTAHAGYSYLNVQLCRS